MFTSPSRTAFQRGPQYGCRSIHLSSHGTCYYFDWLHLSASHLKVRKYHTYLQKRVQTTSRNLQTGCATIQYLKNIEDILDDTMTVDLYERKILCLFQHGFIKYGPYSTNIFDSIEKQNKSQITTVESMRQLRNSARFSDQPLIFSLVINLPCWKWESHFLLNQGIHKSSAFLCHD